VYGVTPVSTLLYVEEELVEVDLVEFHLVYRLFLFLLYLLDNHLPDGRGFEFHIVPEVPELG
jgi:hypothetical protein